MNYIMKTIYVGCGNQGNKLEPLIKSKYLLKCSYFYRNCQYL